jgi:hypothetical protein
MIVKLILICLIAKVAAEGNPCKNRIEPNHFARNPRGCSWYFVCEDNEVVRENRCEKGFHFNYDRQMCDYRDSVYCDLDDRNNVQCPEDRRGIAVIPHPYTCLKYTGETETDSLSISITFREFQLKFACDISDLMTIFLLQFALMESKMTAVVLPESIFLTSRINASILSMLTVPWITICAKLQENRDCQSL